MAEKTLIQISRLFIFGSNSTKGVGLRVWSIFFFLCLSFAPLLGSSPLLIAKPDHSQPTGESRQTYAAEGIDQRLSSHIQFNPEGTNTIGRVVIDDRSSGINQGTWIYVKTALDYYKKTKPLFIILELNTPGGEVFAAQRISDALKEMDTQFDIPVIAFIDNWAISAGAMLAYSTRFITLVNDAAMGAAEPVIQSQDGMVAASEKVNSAIRTDFANRARFFGRNPLIAEAMVDKDIILVLREGKIVKLDSEEQIHRSDKEPDQVITAKGKLLTLNAEEMMEYKVGDILLEPKKLSRISDQDKERGRWPGEKELLFEYPFFKKIPNPVVDTYQMDWKTSFLTLLSHPVVSSVLMLGLMLGLYVEFTTPGFGLPGTVGVICLFLILLSSFALQAISWLEVILFLAGTVLLVVDLFLIPSFGLMGTVGVIFLLAGLFGMLLPGLEGVDFEYSTQTFNAAGEYVVRRLAWLSATLLLGLSAILLLARYALPKFSPFQRFVLTQNEFGEDYIAGEKAGNLPQSGTRGISLTTLRPSGKVDMQDKIYDAVAAGEFIESGAAIEVAYLDGSVIVVQKLDEKP